MKESSKNFLNTYVNLRLELIMCHRILVKLCIYRGKVILLDKQWGKLPALYI